MYLGYRNKEKLSEEEADELQQWLDEQKIKLEKGEPLTFEEPDAKKKRFRLPWFSS